MSAANSEGRGGRRGGRGGRGGRYPPITRTSVNAMNKHQLENLCLQLYIDRTTAWRRFYESTDVHFNSIMHVTNLTTSLRNNIPAPPIVHPVAVDDEYSGVIEKLLNEFCRDRLNCPICQEMPTQNGSCTTRCGHVYCKNCLAQWLVNHSECPLCRKVLR